MEGNLEENSDLEDLEVVLHPPVTFSVPSAGIFAHSMPKKETVALMGEISKTQ